jgi:hypothetical protein
MTQQIDDGLIKLGTGKPEDREVVPNRETTLFRSIRFHSSMVTFIFVLAMLSLLVVFAAFGGVSFVLLLFLCGALGGITNNYLRLREIPVSEKDLMDPLTNKLAILQVYVSPVIAGVFGFILYSLFLSGIVQGSLFPDFSGIELKFDGVGGLFTDVAPANNLDAARALIWAFIAGFSERMVPNILDKVAKEGESDTTAPGKDAK